MIYDLERKHARPSYAGQITTWDETVVDAEPATLRFLIGYPMRDVLPWMHEMRITYTVTHDGAR